MATHDRRSMLSLFTSRQWADHMACIEASMRAAGVIDDVAKIVVMYIGPNPGPIAFAELEPIVFYSSNGYAPPVWIIDLNRGRLDVRIDDDTYGSAGYGSEPIHICSGDALLDFVLGEPTARLGIDEPARTVIEQVRRKIEQHVRWKLCQQTGSAHAPVRASANRTCPSSIAIFLGSMLVMLAATGCDGLQVLADHAFAYISSKN